METWLQQARLHSCGQWPSCRLHQAPQVCTLTQSHVQEAVPEARQDETCHALQALQQDSAAPERCTPDVMQAITRQHMQCPSMWAIFPLQDLFALNSAYNQRPAAEETINDPTVKHHYW